MFSVLFGLVLTIQSSWGAPADVDFSGNDFDLLKGSPIQVIDRDDCETVTMPAGAPGQKDVIHLTKLEQVKLERSGDATSWSAWEADGAKALPATEKCSGSDLENAILAEKSSFSRQAEGIRNFFNRCETILHNQGVGALRAFYEVTQIRYDICRNSRLRKVHIRLSDGTYVRGILGLKSDHQPRPMIIAKCGVFCNMNDPSIKLMLMHLFDESPFNILVLTNVTGSSFVRDNERVDLGGLEEGLQMIQVAQLLRSTHLSSKILSLHAVGISLGGHAALYASFYNQFFRDNEGKPLLQSVFAGCPVVDLQASVEDLFDSGVRGKVAQLDFSDEYSRFIDKSSILKEMFPEQSALPEGHEISRRVAEFAIQSYSKKTPGWLPGPINDLGIQNETELWALNNFLHWADQDRTTPTLIWAGRDDWVVQARNNTVRLDEQLKKTKNPDLQVVLTDWGNHCALSRMLGWDVTSSLLRTHALVNSPNS